MLFHAKKEYEYVMRVSTKGRDKLIMLNVEHFTYKGTTDKIAKTSSVKPH